MSEYRPYNYTEVQGEQLLACGRCGAVVIVWHAERHDAWHNRG